MFLLILQNIHIFCWSFMVVKKYAYISLNKTILHNKMTFVGVYYLQDILQMQLPCQLKEYSTLFKIILFFHCVKRTCYYHGNADCDLKFTYSIPITFTVRLHVGLSTQWLCYVFQASRDIHIIGKFLLLNCKLLSFYFNFMVI